MDVFSNLEDLVLESTWVIESLPNRLYNLRRII